MYPSPPNVWRQDLAMMMFIHNTSIHAYIPTYTYYVKFFQNFCKSLLDICTPECEYSSWFNKEYTLTTYICNVMHAFRYLWVNSSDLICYLIRALSSALILKLIHSFILETY